MTWREFFHKPESVLTFLAYLVGGALIFTIGFVVGFNVADVT